MHERVDLKLGFVERVLRRRYHVPIDDLADPRIKAHLRKKFGKMIIHVVAFVASVRMYLSRRQN